jgi:hypothetical protein
LVAASLALLTRELAIKTEAAITAVGLRIPELNNNHRFLSLTRSYLAPIGFESLTTHI